MNDNNIQIDNEFNIFNLFSILWNKKYTIILVSLLFLIISIIYVQFYTKVLYQGSLELKPASQEFLAKFKNLNRSESLGIEIDEDKLMKEFVNNFNEYEILKSKITEAMPYDDSSSETLYAYNDLVKSIAFEFMIIEKEDTSINPKKYLIYNTTDTNFSEKIIKETLDEIKISLAAKLKREIQNLIDAVVFSINQEYRETEDEISLKIFHYNISINNRIEFLKEQASIARELSISQNQLDFLSEAESNANNLIGINVGEMPFYNRGYIAIEKEIELLENREDEAKFIELLPDLLQKKKKLEIQALRAQEVNTEILKNLKLDSIDFEPIQYDLSLITYEIMSIDKKIIVFLSLILGVFISSTYVIIISSYKNYTNRVINSD